MNIEELTCARVHPYCYVNLNLATGDKNKTKNRI